MLPTSLCRHTRHHQTRLALYSSQAHSGIVSATLEQLGIMYTWLHSCPDRPSTYLSGLAERGESPQVRGTSPAYAAPHAPHCTGIVTQYHQAKAAPPVAHADHLTSLQDSETVAKRVCQAPVRRGKSPQVRGTSPAYAARRARHCHGIMSHDVLGDDRQP